MHVHLYAAWARMFQPWRVQDYHSYTLYCVIYTSVNKLNLRLNNKQKHPQSDFCVIASICYIWSVQQILHVHQKGNFLNTGPLQGRLSGKIYIVFRRSHLLIYGFLTKCPLTINGDATTWPCGGTWFRLGCVLLLEWCMHISETRVYGERGRFFHLSAFRGAKGDVKALGIGWRV